MSDAEELLAFARDLIDRADVATAGFWPRAAAFLARQAFETAVGDLWHAKIPAVASCSMRAQLLALSTATDPPTARRARHVYSAVSRACHHHAYDLAPAADELRAWIDEIASIVKACQEAGTPDADSRQGALRVEKCTEGSRVSVVEVEP